MCIITYKTKENKNLWSYDTLKTMFQNNPDGAGIMFSYNNKVYYYKGLMCFEKFYNLYNKLNQKYNFKNLDVALHFRIKTHGGIDTRNTHPFIITHDFKKFDDLSGSAAVALMHNGIIYNNTTTNNKYNDTCNFIVNYLYYIHKLDNNFFNNKSAIALIENIINSKMLFLTNNGFVALGDFLQDENDLYYSNDSYKDYISYFTSSYLNDYKTFSKYTSKYIYYDNYITEITLNKKDVEMLKHKYFIDKKINDQIYISSDGLVLEKVNSYKYKYDDEFCSYVELENFTGDSCIVGGAIYDY